VAYEYDGNNRLSAIDIPSVGRVTVNSYRWNRPDKVTLPGGSQINLSYDALMRLKSKVVKDATQNILMNYGYEYSPSSNITKKSTENGDYDYAYDELYRLISATNPVLSEESFVYDLLGNRLNDGATFDRNNALLSNDDASFEYDLNGNLVRKTVGGEVVEFVYDVANLLVSVKENGNLKAEYGYDPFGRRIWKEVGGTRTYFAYSDEGLIGEFDESGTEIKGYGWKPDSTWSTNPLFLRVNGSYLWYQNDHLGTPQLLVDGQGLVVWEAVYSAFGEARLDVELVESNLRFAGQYFDEETGLHYNWWRFYDPGLGRYLRIDPIWVVNLYGYAYQNPLGFVDPLGLEGESANSWWSTAIDITITTLDWFDTASDIAYGCAVVGTAGGALAGAPAVVGKKAGIKALIKALKEFADQEIRKVPKRVEGYHGTKSANIRAIQNDELIKPGADGKIYVSDNPVDTFMHGGDETLGGAVSGKVTIDVSSANSVRKVSVHGNPNTTLIETNVPLLL